MLPAYAPHAPPLTASQEMLKVLLITVVSTQMLPSVKTIQRTPAREAVRLGLRGLLGLAYLILRAL